MKNLNKKILFYSILILIIFTIIFIFYRSYNYLYNKNLLLIQENNKLVKNINSTQEENYIIKKDKLIFWYFLDDEIIWKEKMIINDYWDINKNLQITHSYMPSSGVCYDSTTKILDNSWEEKIIFWDKNKEYCAYRLEYFKDWILRFPICYLPWAWSWECEQAVFDYDLLNETWEFREVKYFITDYEDEFLDYENWFERDEKFWEFIRFFEKNYNLINSEIINQKYFEN